MNKEYFFKDYPKEDLLEWTKRLKYFHFLREVGGWAQDGNMLAVTFTCTDTADLIKKLKQLGEHVIETYNLNNRIGWTKVLDHDVFIYFHNKLNGLDNQLEMSISGTNSDVHDVTVADVNVAVELETLVDDLGWAKYKSNIIELRSNCFCKENFPELFEN
jgi:hypothetical protein